jgi:uncharacterized protein YodC (DUF2158 family)
MKFKPGDIVNLKSSGPEMTVASVRDGIVNCIWFDGKRDKRKAFPVETLQKKPKPPRKIELNFGWQKSDKTS